MAGEGEARASRIGEWTAVIGGVSLLASELLKAAKLFGIPSAYLRFLCLAALLIGIFLAVRDRLFARSRLARPDLLRLEVRTAEELLGRAQDIEDLAELCQTTREVHLVGESGVGKSVLVEVGLRPYIAAHTPLTLIHMDSWGDDWEEGPRAALAAAVWETLSIEERGKLGLAMPIRPEAAFSTLRLLQSQLGRTPLLVFDQFDDYVVEHRQQLLGKHRTWLNATELAKANPFWAEVRDCLAARIAHVLFVARATEADALHAVRFDEPKVYRLEKIGAAFVRPLLEELTRKGLVSRPNGGWYAVVDRLVDALSQDGTVLPVQLRVALRGLESLPTLTLRDYYRAGGLRGLEATLIERHVASVSGFSGLSRGSLLHLLLGFIDRDRLKGHLLRRQVLLQSLTPYGGARAADEAIEYFVSREILRERIDRSTGDLSYSLYHDYLCRGILEAQRRANLLLTLLREHERRYAAATGYWARWRELLSPGELAVVLGHRLRRKLRLGDLRPYVAASSLRLIAPMALALVLLLGLADAGLSFPGAQSFRNALDRNQLSPLREIYRLEDLIARSRKVRPRFVQALLDRREVGWFITAPGLDDEHDYWTHAQALCAALRAPETREQGVSILRDNLSRLFAPNVLLMAADRPLGWASDETNTHSRAEPALWTSCAVSHAFRHLAAESRVSEWAGVTDRASYEYYDPGSGSWDVVADPVGPTEGSVYEASLALLALAERRGANQQVGAPWSSRDTAAARATAAWLATKYVAGVDGHPGGWLDGLGESHVSIGLTYQVISSLLRAERLFEFRLPANLEADAKTLLRTPTAFPATNQYTVRLKRQFFLDPMGHRTTCPFDVTFLSFPWAIDATTQWLAREARQGERDGDPLVRRTLSRLLDQVEELNPPPRFTFHVSELVYALTSVEELAAELEPAKPPSSITPPPS